MLVRTGGASWCSSERRLGCRACWRSDGDRLARVRRDVIAPLTRIGIVRRRYRNVVSPDPTQACGDHQRGQATGQLMDNAQATKVPPGRLTWIVSPIWKLGRMSPSRPVPAISWLMPLERRTPAEVCRPDCEQWVGNSRWLTKPGERLGIDAQLTEDAVEQRRADLLSSVHRYCCCVSVWMLSGS